MTTKKNPEAWRDAYDLFVVTFDFEGEWRESHDKIKDWIASLLTSARQEERERLRKVVEGMKITDKLWLIEPENKSYNAALDSVLKELD